MNIYVIIKDKDLQKSEKDNIIQKKNELNIFIEKIMVYLLWIAK